MANENLSRRAGTTDYGQLYEQRIAALIGVKSVLNDYVTDMWMATNVNGLGAFDDLVLFLKTRNRNGSTANVYLFQIKHKQHKSLRLSPGKNDLLKYQESFFKIRNDFIDGSNTPLNVSCEFENIKFILFTNNNIVLPENAESCEYKHEVDFLNAGDVFQISHESPTPYDTNFLKQTFFHQNQSNYSEVESQIKEESEKYFINCNVKQITEFFENWHFRDFENTLRLTKDDIESKLLEIMLSPYIAKPIATSFPKADIWNQVTKNFELIFLEKEKHLSKAWQAVEIEINHLFSSQNISISNFNEPLQDAPKIIYEIKQRFQTQHVPIKKEKSSYNVENLYLMLWQVGYVPLILNLDTNQQIPVILSKLGSSRIRRRYIFLGRFTRDFPHELDSFNFLNIENSTRKEVLKNISISLPFKEPVALDELKLSDDVLKKVTPDLLMETLQVTEENDVTADYVYLSRFIRTPVASFNVLGLADVVSVIIIDDNLPISHWKMNAFGTPYPWDAYKLLTTEHSDKNLMNSVLQQNISIIYYTKAKCNLKEFSEIEKCIKIVRKREDQTVHFYKFLDSDGLQWIYSNQNSHQVKPFLVSRHMKALLPDVELFKYLTFNILTGNAGEGKSTLLHFLSRNSSKDTWVVKLNMREIVEYISEGDFTDVKRFLHNQSNTDFADYEEFSWELFQHSLEKLYMIVLIDGLDEVECNANIDRFFMSLNSIQIKTLIVSRPSLQEYLQEKFGVLSLSLEPFTEEDCNLFIERSWKKTDEFKGTYSHDVFQKITLWRNVVGVPLLLKLVVALFSGRSFSEFKELDITDLFDLYISAQLKKCGPYTRSTLRTLKKLSLFAFYKKNAIYKLFSDEEYFEDVEDNIKIYEAAKITEKITNIEDPVFVHRSLAEFLVAKYFPHLVKTQSRGLMKPFINSLFYKELETVRLFFDIITLKGSPLQEIITNSHSKLLCESIDNRMVDSFGRNALHIAASFGSSSDLRGHHKLWKGVKKCEAYTKVHSSKEIELCQKIERDFVVPLHLVRELLKKGFDPYQKDTLFIMNVFDFAIESGSLAIIDILFGQNKSKKLKRVDKNILLYSVIQNGYVNIFKHIPNKDLSLKILPSGDNLLHIGLSSENFELICSLTDGVANIDVPNAFGYSPFISWLSSLKRTGSNGLLNALNENQIKIITHLIQKNVNLYNTNNVGETPLHLFSASENSHIVEIILRSGNALEKMNCKTSHGNIPLHYAAMFSLKNVKNLVDSGSEIDIYNNFGHTPLCLAAARNLRNIVSYLIRRRAHVNSNGKGMDPLNAAALKGHVECMKLLINKGASINNTPMNNTLEFAVRSGNLECVRYLIEKGAELSPHLLIVSISFHFKEISKYILSKYMKQIPIEVELNCISEEETDLIDILIWGGVDINSKHAEGYTLLHLAALRGLENFVRHLIKSGAKTCIEDNAGYPALIMAARNGHLRTSEVLIQSGSNLQKYGPLAVCAAAIGGHCDIMDYLISAGADVNGYINNDLAPIHYAIVHNDISVIKLLIDKGAIINRKTVKNSFTPLMLASQLGRLDVVKFLVKNRADINEESRDHISALTLAAAMGHLECAKFLVENGTNLLQYGPTALYFAICGRHTSVLDYFIELMQVTNA